MIRHYTALDRLLMQVDDRLGALFRPRPAAQRAYPAETLDEPVLTTAERRHSAGLMRVNHAGEVAAQSLYYGQAVFSRAGNIRARLQQAAMEEADHLAWCERRLREIADRTSWLNPLWGSGSFAIGLVAGLTGDKWSLGFIAETENQVVRHLEGHLQRLPPADTRSRVILEQMVRDEASHGENARDAGGAELPLLVRRAMAACSGIMTRTAYYL